MNINAVVKDPLTIKADAIVNPVGLFVHGSPEFEDGLGRRVFIAAGDALPEFCRKAVGDDTDDRRCAISQSFKLDKFRYVVNLYSAVR